MADYDIFREQLAIKYPSYGHALWGPSPRNPDRPVQIGDVGFIRRGKFYRLFNALLPADDPSHEFGVPEYHEPLIPTTLNHLDTDSLGRNDYCSAGVSIEPDTGLHSDPDDFPKVSFQNKRTQGAAILSLPVAARREDTLARGDFKRWIVKHIDSWFVFARNLGLGIEEMEEIILVTGRDLTRSWVNVAFLGNEVDAQPAQVSFGVNVEGPGTAINYQFTPGNTRGAVLRHGPEGPNLPENQSVFIRGFRVARSFWILPRRLKAAAGPSTDLGGNDCDPDREVISIPAITKYRDPIHLLLEYIAEEASDCDMVLAHDDDLVSIDGLGHDTSLEAPEPNMIVDLLRRSNIEIHKIWSPINGVGGPDSDMVKVAMLSVSYQNWNTAPRSQWSPLSVQNVDFGHSGESRGTSLPATLPSPPLPTTRGETNNGKNSLLMGHCDSASATLQDLGDGVPLDRGHDADIAEDPPLVTDKTRNPPSGVWSGLRKFAQVERHRLVPSIVITSRVVFLLVLAWIFSFTLDTSFKLISILLVASVPLSVLFERKNTHRRLNDKCDPMSNPSHRFIPPSADDSRSPCPALNALANHSILPHNGRDISAYQLISVLREHYHISLPLAVLLSVGGTFACGRHFKIDLEDLARHNVIEHDASLTHANAIPESQYAPISVDKELLQHLLGVSKNPDVLAFDELVAVRANRDATLSMPPSKVHDIIARGKVALTVQTFGNEEGNMPKKHIREWFGEERLPSGWSRPMNTIGIWNTTRISNWVAELVKKKLE